MKNIFFILFVLICFSSQAQKNDLDSETKVLFSAYTTAKNGLNYRKEPNETSEILGKFDYGTKVDIVDNSSRNFLWIDGLERGDIYGKWVGVKKELNIVYVFNGYLFQSSSAIEEHIKLINGNIGYVTLSSIKDGDIQNIKDEFKKTKGIIIDIRNYPSTFVVFSLGSYFVSSSTSFVKFTNGNVDNPGEFTFTEEVKIPGKGKTYKGKLIVLINELSQSQAEYTAMAFKAGNNTTVIGSTTAGADGNVSEIILPGGLRTMISGIGVNYPNGEETQRIGIVPDLEVQPTIEGIRQGKDELLEKAIEIILEK